MPIHSLEFRVEASTLRLRKTTITGRIHMALDAVAFPEEDWDDFVVIVLGWWCAALSGVGTSVDLDFMDGSFRARLSGRDPGVWNLRLEGRPQDEILKGIVEKSATRASLLAAATQVLDECAERGWRTDEIRELAERREALAAATR